MPIIKSGDGNALAIQDSLTVDKRLSVGDTINASSSILFSQNVVGAKDSWIEIPSGGAGGANFLGTGGVNIADGNLNVLNGTLDLNGGYVRIGGTDFFIKAIEKIGSHVAVDCSTATGLAQFWWAADTSGF